jgi:hypothetical protein
MAITVVCPGCFQRFQVSDKFGGQKGPCPKCKSIIDIPKETVVVHEADEYASGGRGKLGQFLARPIERLQVSFSPVQIVLSICGILTAIILTFVLGRVGLFESMPILAALGLMALSPLLIAMLFPFLVDDEDMENIHGTQLFLRAAICGLVFSIAWCGLELGKSYMSKTTSSSPDVKVEDVERPGSVHMRVTQEDEDASTQKSSAPPWFLLILIPCAVIGIMSIVGVMDISISNGVLLYLVWIVSAVLLRTLAGLGWIWAAAGA